MIRTRTLGIAVVMALALTAFAGAGSASANYFKAAVEPEAWNGELSGSKHSLYLGTTGPGFICKGVAFSGQTKAKTLSDVKVSPQISECEHLGVGSPYAWQMNGCKFRFKPGPGPALTGTMDIADCTKPMEYYNISAPSCYQQIGNQNGLGKVEYQNILVGGVPAVKVIANLTGITYTRHAFACSEGVDGTFSDGTYYGEWIVKGATVPGGAAAGVEIQAATVSSPRFNAEEGPATLSGVKSGGPQIVFDFGVNGEIGCEKFTYGGVASLVPTEAITVTPGFNNCAYGNSKEAYYIPDYSLTPGFCSYQLHAKGGFDIVGASCAASPITVTISGCVFKVGPQNNAVGPTFKNQGSGKSRAVNVATSPLQKNMTYTATGAGCVKQGTMNEASVRVPVFTVLSAKDSSGAAQGFWLE